MLILTLSCITHVWKNKYVEDATFDLQFGTAILQNRFTMGIFPRLEFDINLINCLRCDFYIYGAFEFLCKFFVNSWHHV